jgi:hypothetical protein
MQKLREEKQMADKENLRDIRRCPTCGSIMHKRRNNRYGRPTYWHVCDACGETIEITEVLR